MASVQLTHDSILNSNAQVLILPVNSAGTLLDPVLMRSKSLYPDNYQRYYRACRDGSAVAGSCLLHKRERERVGLSASHNGNQPCYIANLIISNHPYHPTRERWLSAALLDLQQQLLTLIRYQGIRKMAFLARPLIAISHQSSSQSPVSPDASNFTPLDWHTTTLPLLTKYLQDLPKVRTELHLPKTMALEMS